MRACRWCIQTAECEGLMILGKDPKDGQMVGGWKPVCSEHSTDERVIRLRAFPAAEREFDREQREIKKERARVLEEAVLPGSEAWR